MKVIFLRLIKPQKNLIYLLAKKITEEKFKGIFGKKEALNEYSNKRKTLKGIENVKREFNREIMNELLIRKIKKHMPNLNEIDIKNENAKVQIKLITEEMLNHFSTLKGFTSMALLNTHVESLIRIITKRTKVHEDLFGISSGNPHNESEKSLNNYRMVEAILSKKYTEALEMIKILKPKSKLQNSEVSNSKTEIRKCIRQVINQSLL